jgi:hypothetical protein
MCTNENRWSATSTNRLGIQPLWKCTLLNRESTFSAIDMSAVKSCWRQCMPSSATVADRPSNESKT